MHTAPDAPGRLRITVTARDAACRPKNTLTEPRFTAATNAQVDVGDSVLHVARFVYPLPTSPRQATSSSSVRRPGRRAS
jgi:hypothetical protein